MHTKDEIEERIRTMLPIIFGKSESIAYSKYKPKYIALADFAAKATEPILKTETIRYQSILIYWSFTFLVLHLFRIGKFKIGEAEVTIDQRLFTFYFVFIIAVAILFLLKAYVDYQRDRLIRNNSTAIADHDHFIFVGMNRRNIQQHFYEEICNAIGLTYPTYSNAKAILLGTAAPECLALNLSTLNLAELSKVPELKLEIDRQQANLASIRTELKTDEDRLKNRIDTIIKEEPADADDWSTTTSFNQITLLDEAYNDCLGRWFEARNTLSFEHCDQSIQEIGDTPEIKKLKASLTLLIRTKNIWIVYGLLEVVAPVIFAVASILYVWTGRA